MKVLYLVHQFLPRYFFGTETFTFNIATQMRKMGHEPLILTFDPKPSRNERGTVVGQMRVRTYEYAKLPVIAFSDLTTRAMLRTIYNDRIENTFSKLRITDVDLVHVCHPMRMASIAKRLSVRKDLPIVVTLTDTWLLCPRAQIDKHRTFCNGPVAGEGCKTHCIFRNPSELVKWHDQAFDLLGRAGEVVTASRFTAETFKNNGWTGPIRMVVHSVDYQHIQRVPPTKSSVLVLVFIGSTTFQKGLHVLLKAMKSVRQSNVVLKVHAPLEDNPRYGQRLLDLASGDERIHFLGKFDMDDFPKVIAGASALVVPSVYPDNYPLVVLLSLACRVPVIGSNVGGIPEMIEDGGNGLLFGPGNSEELASIIEELATNPDMISNLRRGIVRPRRTEEEAYDYERIYERLA